MSIMITEITPSPSVSATINVCISTFHAPLRTHPEQGLSQMAVILSQAVAPSFDTSLFAFSIQSGIAGGNLTWIILFALSTSPQDVIDIDLEWLTMVLCEACAGALHSMTLREPVNGWRKDMPY